RRGGRLVVRLHRQAARLMLLDLTTRRVAELANGANVGWPEWSHDSKSVVFWFASRDSGMGIFRVRIGDHTLEEILSLKDVRLASGLIGGWTGLAPDDSPLMLRDAETQDIYALAWQA